jgi:hypothetical protein
VDIAITLNMDADEALGLHSDYLQISSKDKLMLNWTRNGDIHLLECLCRELKCIRLVAVLNPITAKALQIAAFVPSSLF